jgi:hypothetical protein
VKPTGPSEDERIMTDSEGPHPPHPPYDEYRSALGEDTEGHAAIDDLRAALHDSEPQRAHISASVDRLRAIPVLEARVANWWDSPRTQNWLKILSDAGL